MLPGMRPSPGGPHHGGTLLPPPGPGMGMGPPPGPGGPALSPGGGPMALSPTAVPPVSPGNRRFMAAMNDLIAGPSDDQRRQKDMARQQLQADLEAQIREKKERQVGLGSVGGKFAGCWMCMCLLRCACRIGGLEAARPL